MSAKKDRTLKERIIESDKLKQEENERVFVKQALNLIKDSLTMDYPEWYYGKREKRFVKDKK